MKIKNINLEWNVLYEDFNNKKIKTYNIFNNDFIKELHNKFKKKEIKSLSELKNFIKKWAMYHYWSRCEWEICVGGLFSKYPDEFEKIDIYTQIEINLDRITDYVNIKLKLNL